MIRFFLIFLIACLISNDLQASASYYRSITVAHSQVSTNDQASFPILVCANGSGVCNTSVSGLNQTGGGAHVQNSNGYDIGFFTDSGCTTKVAAWEMENYNASTGEFEAWVNNGTLSHTADTTIYLCYGDATISSFQSTATAVWDSNYKGVWHMQETGTGAAGDYKDSTSNGNNSSNTTNQPSKTTSGIIAGAESFNGSTSQITVPSTLSGLTSFTISGWIKQSSSGGLFDSWFCNASYYGTNQMARQYANSWQAYATGGNGKVSGSGLTDDSWNYIVLTYVSGGTNGVIFYINGSAQASVATYTGAVASHSNDAMGTDGSNYAKAIMEEFRASGSVRSADWIATEYNNQSAPSTFMTIGAETAIGGAAYVPLNRGLVIQGGKTKIMGAKVKVQ